MRSFELGSRFFWIKVEAATAIVGSWIAQGDVVSSLGAWERIIVRWGALGIVAMALYRLLWHEIPAWRNELREERNASREAQEAERKAHKEGLERIAESMDRMARKLGNGGP